MAHVFEFVDHPMGRFPVAHTREEADLALAIYGNVLCAEGVRPSRKEPKRIERLRDAVEQARLAPATGRTGEGLER